MKKVEIWTFRMCPFCVKAKKLLDKLEIEYEETVIPWGDSRLQELEAKTGCGSLPQIFVDGEFVGDCSKIHDLHDEGVLENILKG
jgi:glutaredoxin 3